MPRVDAKAGNNTPVQDNPAGQEFESEFEAPQETKIMNTGDSVIISGEQLFSSKITNEINHFENSLKLLRHIPSLISALSLKNKTSKAESKTEAAKAIDKYIENNPNFLQENFGLAGVLASHYAEGNGKPVIINFLNLSQSDLNEFGQPYITHKNNGRFVRDTVGSDKNNNKIISMEVGKKITIKDYWTDQRGGGGDALFYGLGRFIVNSFGEIHVNREEDGYHIELESDHIITDYYNWDKYSRSGASFEIGKVNLLIDDSTMAQISEEKNAKEFHVFSHGVEKIKFFIPNSDIKNFLEGTVPWEGYVTNRNIQSVDDLEKSRDYFEKSIEINSGHEDSVPPLELNTADEEK